MKNRFIRWLTLALLIAVSAACAPGATVGVNSVSVTPESPSVEVGGTVQLDATVDAVGGADETVVWSSSDDSVATVNEDGLVTGQAEGTAEITATSTVDATKAGSVTVTVTAAPQPAVNSVTIVEGEQTITEGETFDFSATVDAVAGADESVVWSSSDENIATVDTDGVVTGVAEGVATITATSTFDPTKSDTVTVTVTAAAEPAVNAVSIAPETPVVEVGSAVQLNATVDATGGADESVVWSSSDGSIATVDSTGLVMGVAEGEAAITATSTFDPTKSATVTVTVATDVQPAVTDVTIVEAAQTLTEGETFDYSATVTAVGGADETVIWSSSDDNVATVNADGLVTAVAAGTATITATSAFDNSVSDSVTVTVEAVVYVDDDAAAGGDGSQAAPYATIQEAIDAVSAGATVNVLPGSYTNNLTIGKSLTFLGANAGVVTSRTAESTVTGTVTIDGAGIDVSFNGFEFRSGVDPSIVSFGTDHSVAYTYNVFDGGIEKVKANQPATFTFQHNAANVSAQSGGGFVQVAGDYDGTSGTSVSIADNVMTFDFPSTASPAINVGSSSGTVSGNTIDMTQIVAGQDDTRIALLIAGTSGNLTVQNNTMSNANQGIRFAFINASGLGPVTIDGNTLVGLRQGIMADSGGDLNNVAVSNNTFTDNEEGIRVAQAGLSINNNAFNNTTAFTAYVIDATGVSGAYDLSAVLANNSFDPAAAIGTADSFPAIVAQ